MLPRPLQRLASRRELIRQFTPNWFTATMGTGILALALNQLPLAAPGLKGFAAALWMLDVGLFVLCSLMYAARWLFFFDGARRIFGHPTMCMFLGAIPMGLATIVNGLLAFGVPRWGEAAVDVAHGLWWLDVALSVACGTLVPYLMFTRQDHRLDRMTAVWLLPIVACEVAAASAGLLLPYLPASAEATRILFIGYGLWAMSVLPALGVLVLLFLRLVLHKLPHRDMAVSCWLALGPIGTGALGLITLGDAAPSVIGKLDPLNVGSVAHAIGIVGATVLWGYGLWWFALAALMTLRYLKEGLPFNMGWWGFTFPIGVYSVATLALGRETGAGFYQGLGIAFVALLTFFWILVTARTVHGAWHGHLFVAPCLSGGGGEPDCTNTASRPVDVAPA